jgi:hypothetical protein
MNLILVLASSGTLVGAVGTVIASVYSRRQNRRTSRYGRQADIFWPPETKRHRARRRRLLAVALAGILLTAAGAGWFITRSLSYCGTDVQRLDNQCIGITDGSYVFDAGLADVEGLIKQENQWVAAQARPYVTIAYLGPMVRSADTPWQLVSVVHQLEGAYLAQYAANRTVGQPLIKLYLANDGNLDQMWLPIVDQLRDMAPAAHLVAVVGLGGNTSNVRSAATALVKAGLPVVSSADTDGFALPGLFTVAPTIDEQVAALVSESDTGRSVLVTDSNPADQYSAALSAAVERHLSASDVFRYVAAFDDSYNEETLDVIVPNVCAVNARTIYFAGRTTDLVPLLRALGERRCGTEPLVVRTVADVSLDPGIASIVASTGITVEYAALAQPDQWSMIPVTQSQQRAAATFGEFSSRFQQHFGATSQLTDGQAMMGHDSLLTTISAVRIAAQELNDMSPRAVLDALHDLHGLDAVDGVSGVIDLDAQTGRPVDKPIPVVRIDHDGHTSTVRLVVLSQH